MQLYDTQESFLKRGQPRKISPTGQTRGDSFPVYVLVKLHP